MSGIASGVGGYVALANGSNNGSQYYGVGAQYVTPTRMIPVKEAPGTYNPHIVQGGPYVRYGAYVDYGAANVATYLDAKFNLVGDVMNQGFALLLNQVFGGSQAGAQAASLAAIDSTAAYSLCAAGSQATPYAYLQPQDGSWFDAEILVKDTGGGAQYQQYHSNKITKAEFVFPRDNIVTYSMECDSAYVVLSGSTDVDTTEPANPVPFVMPNASSLFSVGGSNIDGCKKITVTFTPKLATERIYIGQQYKNEPVTNGLVDVTVALEMDYTPLANSEIFSLFVPHTYVGAQFSTGDAVQILAVGSEIESSGFNNQFGFTFPQLWIMSGGEAPLKGLDIIGNTINLKATADSFGDYGAYGLLTTADTTF